MEITLPFRYPDKPTTSGPDFWNSIRAGDWIAQNKYDGWRAIIFIDSPTQIRIVTSNNSPYEQTSNRDRRNATERFREEIRRVGFSPGTVLDSECVGPRGSHDWGIFFFDVLADNGQWLCNRGFEDRLSLYHPYRFAIDQSRLIHMANTVYGSGDTEVFRNLYDSLRQTWDRGGRDLDLCEGVVMKRRAGTMILSPTSSQKSKHQFKIKYRDIREERW